MKCSIDHSFERGIVSGWMSSDSNEDISGALVHISSLVDTQHYVTLTETRLDVKSLGLHSTGECGYAFNYLKQGYLTGDFIRVDLTGKEEETHSRIFICGNKNEAVKIFNSTEYSRDDASVMSESGFDLISNHGDLIAFKILLIRLRRAKRAKGWRGKFEGFNYNHKESDWILFKHFVNACRWTLFDCLSTRYLWSIIDTFGDYAEGAEKVAALVLSSLLIHERFSQTHNNFYDLIEKGSVSLNQVGYWGGMLTNKMDGDDSFDVYMTRSIEILSGYPVIYSLFVELMSRFFNEERSMIGWNICKSVYFKGVAEYYKIFFNRERVRLKFGEGSFCLQSNLLRSD